MQPIVFHTPGVRMHEFPLTGELFYGFYIIVT